MILKNIAVFMFAMSVITQAQRMHVMNADEVIFLDEFMGIAEYKEDGLVITSLNNKASWLDEYKNVDIEINDVIIYTNGKPVKSLEDFRKIYENTAVGEEIKLGIKRGGEMFIVSFKRMDSSKIKRKIITMEAPGGEDDMPNIEMKGDKIFIDGKEVDPDSLEDTGIHIKTKKN